jgi:PAS domain S-box-containing protein
LNILYAFIEEKRIRRYNEIFLNEGLTYVYKSINDTGSIRDVCLDYRPDLIIFNSDQSTITFDKLIECAEGAILPETGFLIITETEPDTAHLRNITNNKFIAYINNERFLNSIPSIILFDKYLRSKDVEHKTIYYRDILLKLSKTRLYSEDSIENEIQRFTELVAVQLNADCISTWIIDEGKDVFSCLDLYLNADNVHDKGIIYPFSPYKEYVKELSLKKLVFTYDVQNNAILSQVQRYKDLNRSVKSEMDAAIFLRGKIKGIINCITLYENREWTITEQEFLSSAADIASLWIEQAFARLNEKKYEQELLVYSNVYKNTNDLVCITDKYFTILNISNSVAKILGYKESEMIGKKVSYFAHQEEKEALEAALIKALNTKTSYGSLFRIRKKDGEYVWLRSFCNFITDERGNINSIVLICEEITKEIKTSEKLSRITEEYTHIIDAIDAVVWRHNPSLPYLNYISKPVEKLTGYTVEECKATSFFWDKVLHPEDKEVVAKMFRSLYENNITTCQLEYRVRTKWGEIIWLRDYVKVIRRDDKPVELVGVIINISPQKENEAVLKESENRFKMLAESSDSSIMLKYLESKEDTKGFFLVNGLAAEMFQYSREEFLDIRPEQLAVSDIKKNFKKLNELPEFTFETTMIRKDGSTFLAVITMKKIEMQKREAALFFIRDITGRKEAEHQLILFKKIIEMTTEALLVVNAKGRLNYYNKSFAKIFKYAGLTKRKFSYRELFTEESMERIINGIRTEAAAGNSWKDELEAIDSEGRIFPVSIEIGLIRDNHGIPLYYFAFITDLTAKKKLDERIRKLSTAVEQSPTSIVITDKKGIVEYVNPRFMEITGYTADEIVGKNQRILKTDYYTTEQYCELWETIYRGDIWHGKFRNKKKNGEFYWVYASISPIKNDAGEITHFLAIKEDITELVTVNESLTASLKEKETLLKEIHHRVKNNLQVISSLLSLQADYIEDVHTRDLFDESTHRIKTMALIHERLYQSENLAQIDYSEYITDLTNYLLRTYRNKAQLVQLNLRLDKIYLPVDYAIPCGLIINELVSNALKYAIVDNKQINLDISFLVDGTLCTLTVADDGAGIPANIELGNTVSLGLQLVYDLACQLEGEIKLEREKGTKFIITFTLAK